MSNRYPFCAVGLFVGLLGGCSTTANLYPIEGPLSKVLPLPTVVASVDGILGGTGNFNLTLPNGEKCEGKWSSAAPMQTSSGTLFSTYGGIANFVVIGPKPGVNRGEAFAACSGGTTIQAEFFTGSGTANGYGIARDSASNIYKMLF
jgi:hypothetical protein